MSGNDQPNDQSPAMICDCEPNTVTFSPFQHLPYDIRHMIWVAAIRPDYPAVHHHSIQEQPPINGTHSSTSFMVFAHGPMDFAIFDAIVGNKKCRLISHSAFYWDWGMWFACKESYSIINERFQLRKWRKIGAELVGNTPISLPHSLPLAQGRFRHRIHQRESHRGLDFLKESWEKQNPQGDMSSHFRTSANRMAVTQPMRDLFIFHYDTRVNNPRWARSRREPERDLSIIFRQFQYSRNIHGLPTVTNFGLYCDGETWTRGFRSGQPNRRRISDTIFDGTPFGLLSEMFATCARHGVDAFHFWLIDRKFIPFPTVLTRELDQWYKGEGETRPAVFYDYEGTEYVELDLRSNTIADDHGIHPNGPGIIEFLHMNSRCWFGPGTRNLPLKIGVLVPRRRGNYPRFRMWPTKI